MNQHSAHQSTERVGVLAWFALAVIWLGGLTFYAAVVVPIGAAVTDSTTQGFITQRVTFWLNALGTAYVALTWTDLRGGAGRGLQVTWCLVAIAQMALWLLHPVLDRMLDPDTLSISDAENFYRWHRYYLLATTIQWGAAVAHVGVRATHLLRQA